METTGLDARQHEIIEIGAIRVNRDSIHHDTFQCLVRPEKKVPPRIETLTGITQEMVEQDGIPLEEALQDFLEFCSDLPLVAFNAEFDIGFIRAALRKHKPGFALTNSVDCALKLARRAWPGLGSYRLTDLAKMGNLSTEGTHRALADCRRTMTVYASAVLELEGR